MLILAVKPGHDGAIAAIKDRQLLFSLESEKDSFARYALLNPMTMLEAARAPRRAAGRGRDRRLVQGGRLAQRGRGRLSATSPLRGAPSRIFGHDVQVFSSSHEQLAHLHGRRHGAARRGTSARGAGLGGSARAPSISLDERWHDRATRSRS